MRRFALLAIGALLMIAAPVSAQTATPIPTPSAQQLAWVQEVVDALQKTSASDASTVNTAVLLLAVAVIGVLILIFFGLRALAKPFFSLLNTLLERVGALEKALTKAEEQKDTVREQAEGEVATMRTRQADLQAQTAKSMSETAGAMLRLGNLLSETESKKESEERGQREVQAVTAHVSADGDATRKALKEVVEKVGEVKDVVEKAATVEALEVALSPVKAQLAAINQTLADVVRRIGTDELKPPNTEPTP